MLENCVVRIVFLSFSSSPRIWCRFAFSPVRSLSFASLYSTICLSIYLSISVSSLFPQPPDNCSRRLFFLPAYDVRYLHPRVFQVRTLPSIVVLVCLIFLWLLFEVSPPITDWHESRGSIRANQRRHSRLESSRLADLSSR